MDFVDVKYINLISSRLPKFKKVKPHLYNCRCPICGDSQKNKNKARGYFYRVKNNTNFKCHNCGINISFNSFLKDFDGSLHKEYVFEKFKDGHTGKGFVVPAPTSVPDSALERLKSSKPVFKKKPTINLPSAFEVNDARVYLHKRAIFDGDYFYAENFQEFVNSIKPGSFENSKYGEPRVVIPLIKDNELIGVQGRALSSNPIKYLTIMFDEDAPKIYGYDGIDKTKTVYVVEGPFDSSFIDNAVAFCGADGDVSCLEGCDIVYVYDNEPRNKEIVGRIEKHTERGEKVVIFPSDVRGKDLNDMVLAGYNVRKLVAENAYQGLQAKLQLSTWKKI